MPIPKALETLKVEELEETLGSMEAKQKVIRDAKVKESELRSRLYLFQERLNLLEEEVSKERLYKESLEVQRSQSLVQVVEECKRVEDLEQQAQATIRELKVKVVT
ncbi:hypothetical protein CR513_51223, partial [Mucuna pruriens]